MNSASYCATDSLLNLETSLLFFLTEAFSVNAATNVHGLEQLRIGHRVVSEFAVKWLLAIDLILVVDFEEIATFDSLHHSTEWLEVAHALEGVEGLQWEWLVLMTASLLQQELVDGKVGIREVELDLATDLSSVAALFLALVPGTNVALAIVAAATSTAPASTASTPATATSTTAVLLPAITVVASISAITLVAVVARSPTSVWVTVIVIICILLLCGLVVAAIGLFCGAVGSLSWL
ncbi:hypothetical protein CB0940_03160 [Cercospora beticola]|uniref:Uncharacterized protein n=1 Tax=Cercospora beticola TaxID=122368 RepID=A0A2G5I318_CERBT|nr:hypothetical protein CB0940_03160 [Cercospora beticola]PIA99194.1 hypothetical protein CB0940_03160 [Cercospora beticola]